MDDLKAKQALIRGSMPMTYQAIQARAAEQGKGVFALVNRGLKGEANCFYAVERGHVVGTPFAGHEIERDVAQLWHQFGVGWMCMWGGQAPGGAQGAADGAH